MAQALQVRNHSFRYKGAERKALNSVNFDAEKGEFLVKFGKVGKWLRKKLASGFAGRCDILLFRLET